MANKLVTSSSISASSKIETILLRHSHSVLPAYDSRDGISVLQPPRNKKFKLFHEDQIRNLKKVQSSPTGLERSVVR